MSSWTDFRDKVLSVAPTVLGIAGTAVSAGNPLVGVAIKTLSTKLLGHPDGSSDQIQNAVMNLPPDKLAEMEVQMKELGFKHEELFVKDTEDARAMYVQTRNPITNWLAIGIVIASGYVIGAVVTGHAMGLKDPTMAATAGTVVGYLFRELKHVLSFHFGATEDK